MKTVREKLTLGTGSVIIVLVTGTLGITLFNTPIRAENADVPIGTCDVIKKSRTSTYVYAYGPCYTQVAAKCYFSGVYSWTYGPKGDSSSRVSCPDVREGAVRTKFFKEASWSSWDYF